jgi:hypothetical protein
VRPVNLAGDRFPLSAQRRFGLAGPAQIAIGMDFGKPRPRFCAARLGVFRAFQHQKRPHGRKGDAAVGPAIPDRREFVLQQHVAEFEGEQHVPARAVIGAADQGQLALAGGDARLGDADTVHPRGLFPHKSARGADDAVHQRDVAGEQIGQLRQKQRRPQIAHQAFVEKNVRAIGLAHAGKDRIVGRDVALAAAGGDDHVGAIEQIRLAGNAGVAERQARRVGAGALPQLHLALIGLFRDLLVKAHRRQRMHDIGREDLVVVRRRVAALEALPIRLNTLAETRQQPDAGDPHLAACAHFTGSLNGNCRRSAQSRIAWRNCGFG